MFRVVSSPMRIRIFIVLEQTNISFRWTIRKRIRKWKYALINAMVLCKSALIKVRESNSVLNFLYMKDHFSIGNSPNYIGNSFHGPEVTSRQAHLEHATFESGMAARHETSQDDNFTQPRVFYTVCLNLFFLSLSRLLIVLTFLSFFLESLGWSWSCDFDR